MVTDISDTCICKIVNIMKAEKNMKKDVLVYFALILIYRII